MIKNRCGGLMRGLAASLSLVLIMCVGTAEVVAVSSVKNAVSTSGEYTVSIESLESAAPLPAVQTAFAKAFGESVTVTVNGDGTQTARIKNHHMVIELFGSSYDANVSSILDADASTSEIESATVISTKKEVFTNGLGSSEQKEITVPDEFTIPLNLDGNNSQELSITVDFMDAFLGGGDPYPTTVTLTLDMDDVVIDVSGLEALIESCEEIISENYTDESFAVLTSAIAKAKSVASNPGTIQNLNAMINELNEAKNGLKYKGEADYSAVDDAIASIPSDMSVFTDESVQRVDDAVGAVERGLKSDRQSEVDAMASAISDAVEALEKKNNNTADETQISEADLSKLKDGTYEITVALWHATDDKESMAADSFNSTARIIVKNGNMTVYVYTKPMTIAGITASLQEMRVEQADGTWIDAVAETQSGDGDPTCFSFTLDELSQYINVKVNPKVQIVGDMELDARIKLDTDSIKNISDETDESLLTPPTDGEASGKGMGWILLLIPILLLVIVGIVVSVVVNKRKKRKKAEQKK